ncbi:MAG: GGDEF domain-containing protein [Gemmatimonadaceae bacterium]|nr:GGDEF domain-containing protein [Gemmatimonadaceae bacterium]
MAPTIQPPFDPHYEETAAEIVRWQAPFRVGTAAGIAGIGLAAIALGWVMPGSRLLGVTSAVAMSSLLVVVVSGYVACVAAIARRARRTRRAGRVAVSLLSVADVTVICGLVLLLSAPVDYDRALLGGLLVLPLTYVYFGRRPAVVVLSALATGYMLLVDIALRAGAPGVAWGHALPTVLLGVIGGALVIATQGGFHERLARLSTLFERAQTGELDATYDVSADVRPDRITVVGRAYNRMREQLATIMLTDPLSGCFNRRGFAEEYRRVLARASRTRGLVALVALDLDHFKQINDTHGHIVGDLVISQTGSLLASIVRAGDVVARTGGEEFVLLLPDTSFDGAVHLAARIVEAFRARDFGKDGRVVVTVSAGVAADTVHDDAMAEDLRARADEALYAAKRSGRDQVVAWSRALGEARRVKAG